VSTDGRTFKEPPATWRPSNDGRRESIYGGSHQSLMGDLIRAGVTGAAGHVDEPYLDGTIRPEILFPAYVSGRNLAEAFYAAMPYLSWQTVIVGDPLCAPFPHAPLPTQSIDAGQDAATELPAHFAKRRLAALGTRLSKEAAALFVRAESRTARKDTAGARQALEAAVTAEPRFTMARLQLASTAEVEGDYDRAIAQFRAILTYAPNDPVALNNLAYDLAVDVGALLGLAPAVVGEADGTLLELLVERLQLVVLELELLHGGAELGEVEAAQLLAALDQRCDRHLTHPVGLSR